MEKEKEKEFEKAKEELINLYLNIKIRTQEEVRNKKFNLKNIYINKYR